VVHNGLKEKENEGRVRLLTCYFYFINRISLHCIYGYSMKRGKENYYLEFLLDCKTMDIPWTSNKKRENIKMSSLSAYLKFDWLLMHDRQFYCSSNILLEESCKCFYKNMILKSMLTVLCLFLGETGYLTRREQNQMYFDSKGVFTPKMITITIIVIV